jgi:hypothetical protein
VQSAASSFEVSLERAVRNLPFAHVVQDAESVAAQAPAMQSMHAVRPVAASVDRPAAQAVHAAPVPARNWPATHSVQSAASSFEVSLERAVRNLPFAHVVQDAESVAAQAPAMQSMHAVRPVAASVD